MSEAFSQGANAADPTYNAQECADVKAWLTRIKNAREFDKGARKQYAMDRRYARGDSGQFEVSIPIAPSYIGILKSFLYARDPDVDVQPAASTNPPPMSEVMEMARAQVMQDPQTQIAMQQVFQQGAEAGAAAALQASIVGVQAAQAGSLPKTTPPPPVPPQVAGQQAVAAWLQQTIRAAADQILEPYHQRLDDAKQFGETLEIIISHAWRQAKLKAQADPWVGSCLTVGIGWLKASWQERTQKDPIIQNQLNDLQDNLARLAATQLELEEGPNNTDELKASIQQQIAGLQAKVEVVIARGLAIDFVTSEDVQVATGYTIEQYKESPWIAHRTFKSIQDARADFPDIAKDLKRAAMYYEQPVPDPSDKRDIASLNETVSAEDADRYRTGAASFQSKEDGYLCVWEVWNKDANTVLTLIEGLDKYAKQPFQPDPGVSRFYPFFALSMLRVDGERHPQSLIQRSRSLLDDINRLYSNKAEHRRRAIPKMAFDATALDESEVRKLTAGGIGELIPLKPTVPGSSLSTALHPVSYPAIDQALYDDAQTRAMLEIIWGIQEALAASIQTAKTATEAEIQQTGTNARTSYMRDAIDFCLDDLAHYSAEILLQKYSHDDVKSIAGPWAFWPEGLTIEEMSILLTVAVKGGSSGKPDTSAQQRSWAQTFPLLRDSTMTIGQLRQSAPTDIADGLAELVTETLARSGDRIDATRFLPPPPSDSPVSQGPMPQMPQAQPAPGPQPPPVQGGSNLAPVPHNGLIGGHRPN